MKKFLGIVFLSMMFNVNVLSEEIILKCKSAKYKWINDGNKISTYSSRKKDKGKWHEWPKLKVQEDNKHFVISTDAEAIYGDYKVTSKFKKIKTKDGTASNGQTTIDFKSKNRKSKATWKGKPYKASEKCKLQKP